MQYYLYPTASIWKSTKHKAPPSNSKCSWDHLRLTVSMKRTKCNTTESLGRKLNLTLIINLNMGKLPHPMKQIPWTTSSSQDEDAVSSPLISQKTVYFTHFHSSVTRFTTSLTAVLFSSDHDHDAFPFLGFAFRNECFAVNWFRIDFVGGIVLFIAPHHEKRPQSGVWWENLFVILFAADFPCSRVGGLRSTPKLTVNCETQNSCEIFQFDWNHQ